MAKCKKNKAIDKKKERRNNRKRREKRKNKKNQKLVPRQTVYVKKENGILTDPRLTKILMAGLLLHFIGTIAQMIHLIFFA